MDYGTRSGKSLSLGITKASQAIFKDTKNPKLGDAPGRHPLFRLQSIGNFTWGYIFIHHMICVLLGASFYFVRIRYLGSEIPRWESLHIVK